MEVYLEPIKIAFLTFPFIALLITIPYLIYEYHKFGSVPFFRSSIVYTFILYLLVAFFLVILPLPTRKEVALMPTRVPQLIPFHFIKDICNNTQIVWNNITSYITLIKNPAIYTILFNLVLTIPFGIYLRYYFEKKWYHVLLATFSLSLFFEITQLTGLYGIYPKAYRLFDVDDLLINTIGGMLGFLVTPLITKFLPSRKKIDETSYRKGMEVSIYRRIMAFLIDIFCYFVLFILSSLFFSQYCICAFCLFLIYYIIIPILSKGYTLGKFMVRIRLVYEGRKYKNLFLILRQIIIYPGLLMIPYYILQLRKIDITSIFIERLINIVIFFLALCYLIFIFQFLLALIGKRKCFSYEGITKTKNESTILVNMDLQEK